MPASGMRHFAIEDGKLNDSLYVRPTARHRDLPEWKRASGLLKGKTEAFYHFGYVTFRRTPAHQQDPRAGYALMPLPVIQDRYDFKPQNFQVISASLRVELKSSSHSLILVDKKTVAAFLVWGKHNSGKGLRDYVRDVLHYPLIQQVICREDLSDLNLQDANLSFTDLSGALLSGDLTATDFTEAILIGTVFNGVSSARQACFRKARCHYLQAEGIDFSGADWTQADVSYAHLTGANFTGCKTLGAILTHTVLDGVKTDADLLSEQKQQIVELKAGLVKQRDQWQAEQKDMQERLQRLYEIQAQFIQKLPDWREDRGAAPLAQCIQRQENQFSFERDCEQQLRALQERLSQATDQSTVAVLQKQLEDMQRQLYTGQIKAGKCYSHWMILNPAWTWKLKAWVKNIPTLKSS